MENIIKENKLIAIYGRTSTSAQEVQETIESQLLEVRKFAHKYGYTIVKEYLDEGWSGDMLARPALDELRLDAKKHIWEAVLIYDPDRLGRRYFYQELVMDELAQLGIETLFVTVPPVKDLNDRMMGGMRGLFAEYERAKISERFRIGKINRVTLGNILLSEAPYGYIYKPNIGKRGTIDYNPGHLEINEEEARNVRDIFSWVADEGLTLRAVVRKLQAQGVSPRKSKRGVWSTSTLSTLLRNTTYIGQAHWGASHAVIPENPTKDQKYKKIKKTSRKMNPESQWMSIKVPRIIEDDLFNRAGQNLKANFAVMGRNKKNDYLLAGSIWCTCGRRRAGEGPQQGKHLYYRCTDRVYSFPLPRSCSEKGVNARIADKAIWERVKEIMVTPEIMRTYAENWKKSHVTDNINRIVIDIENTKKELSKLKNQEDRYTKAYSEGVITLEKLKEFLGPYKEKISSLEKSLAQASIDQKPKLNTALPSDDEIGVFAKEALEYLTNNLSFESKKGIIRKAITSVYSSQKDLQVHGFINLNEIYVKFFTKYRNCRFAECGEVHTF